MMIISTKSGSIVYLCCATLVSDMEYYVKKVYWCFKGIKGQFNFQGWGGGGDYKMFIYGGLLENYSKKNKNVRRAKKGPNIFY